MEKGAKALRLISERQADLRKNDLSSVANAVAQAKANDTETQSQASQSEPSAMSTTPTTSVHSTHEGSRQQPQGGCLSRKASRSPGPESRGIYTALLREAFRIESKQSN